MKLKNISLVLLMWALLTACGPSYSSIDNKIQKGEFQQINENEKEQKAILEYLSEELDFIASHQSMSYYALAKEVEEKFPYSYNFLRYYGLNWLSDSAKQNWDLFLQDQINKGRDKIYGYNPIYEVMANHDRDITEREIPLIAGYVYLANQSTPDNSDFQFFNVISNRAQLKSIYPNLNKAYWQGISKY